MKGFKLIALSTFLFFFLVLQSPAQTNEKAKVSHEFELEVEGEYRYFYEDPLFNKQKNHFPSVAFQPEYKVEWNDGYDGINLSLFARVDQDDSRTHFDIRDFYYQKAKGKWELNIGLKKVYWGVAESIHLVDIINQTDQVESFDGEDKLGQPMTQVKWITDNAGIFEFYYLPYHRKRTFAGQEGRLRFGIVIEEDDIGYESNAEEWRQDLAIHWKHYIGILDIGLSHFYGSGREPFFTIDSMGQFNGIYPVINQSGVELQITHHAFLWKVEYIYRSAEQEDFSALVAGLEFTFSNVNGKGLDIGLIGEYLYDERDELAFSSLENDVFFGSRLALNDENDTAILLGTIMDLEKNTSVFALEASRRIAGSLKLELESRIFSSIDDKEFLLTNFKNDSFFRVSLFKYF